jgi:hypothetical protein
MSEEQDDFQLVPSDQPLSDSQASDETVLVYLTKQYGPLWPGEIAGYPAHIAKGLIASRSALPLDDNGQPIMQPDDAIEESPSSIEPAIEAGKPARRPRTRKSQEPSSTTTDANTAQAIVADDQIKLFLADGLQRDEAAALYAAGLKNPDDVVAAIAAGRDLAEVNGIGPVTASTLKQLYSE